MPSFRGREHSERSPESITTPCSYEPSLRSYSLGLWIPGSLASQQGRLASAPEWRRGATAADFSSQSFKRFLHR